MRTSLLEQKVAEAFMAIVNEQRKSARNKDGASLHDFRVAVRRLRIWLKIAHDKKLVRLKKKESKALKRLVSMTNELRDSEVSLALFKQHAAKQPSADTISKKWEQSVARKYAKVMKELPKHIEKLPKVAIDPENPIAGILMRDLIASVSKMFGKDLDLALSQIKRISDDKAIHRARLAAKALRYLLEPFADELEEVGDLLKRLRRLQDLCGGLRDGVMLAKKLSKMRLGQRRSLRRTAVLEAAAKNNQREMTNLFQELCAGFLRVRSRKFASSIDLKSRIWSNKVPI